MTDPIALYSFLSKRMHFAQPPKICSFFKRVCRGRNLLRLRSLEILLPYLTAC
jgi:hypothetical protein